MSDTQESFTGAHNMKESLAVQIWGPSSDKYYDIPTISQPGTFSKKSREDQNPRTCIRRVVSSSPRMNTAKLIKISFAS